MQQQKIVITGGPSTGKTTLINVLEKEGFLCFPEVIRQMTLQAKLEGDLSSLTTNPINAVSDPMAFNNKIIQARLVQYNSASKTKSNPVIFDRGMPDVLAYMSYYKQKLTTELVQISQQNKYNKVFLLPMWKDIYVQDEERFESFEEALKIEDCLRTSYTQLNYELIEIPKMSVSNRIAFLKENL